MNVEKQILFVHGKIFVQLLYLEFAAMHCPGYFSLRCLRNDLSPGFNVSDSRLLDLQVMAPKGTRINVTSCADFKMSKCNKDDDFTDHFVTHNFVQSFHIFCSKKETLEW